MAADVAGGAEGAEARSESRLVDWSSRLSALPEVPPCWVSWLDGEPTACTWSELLPPPPSA
ncbi:hypothetical protein ACFQ51_29640 [Streptomyces kaempferi]